MKTKYLRLHSAFSAALLATACPAFAQAENPHAHPASGAVSAIAELAVARPVLLGVVVKSLDDETRGKLPADAVPAGAGLVIHEVRDHSPAAEAKLAVGDILLTWNGQPLNTPPQLQSLVRAAKPGEEVKLAYLRQGQRHVVEITLIKAEMAPKDRPELRPELRPEQRPEQRPGLPGRAAAGGLRLLAEPGLHLAQPASGIGVAVERIPDELRDQLPQLKPGAGLFIRRIMDRCDAASAGLQKGDLLISWNGDTLVHPEQLRALVQAAKPGQEITIGYLRKGTEQQAKLTVTEASRRPALRLQSNAGAMELERPLDDGDRFQLRRRTPEERARIFEKFNKIKQQIERMRKNLPAHEHAEEGLNDEIEKLSRELEKALNEDKDVKVIRGGGMLLSPDDKVTGRSFGTIHGEARLAEPDEN